MSFLTLPKIFKQGGQTIEPKTNTTADPSRLTIDPNIGGGDPSGKKTPAMIKAIRDQKRALKRALKKAQKKALKKASKSFDSSSTQNNYTPYMIVGGTIVALFLVNKFL